MYIKIPKLNFDMMIMCCMHVQCQPHIVENASTRDLRLFLMNICRVEKGHLTILKGLTCTLILLFRRKRIWIFWTSRGTKDRMSLIHCMWDISLVHLIKSLLLCFFFYFNTSSNTKIAKKECSSKTHGARTCKIT